ncbi:MAG: YaiI/YqxD family protein [Nitrospirae bacterium]|nr:YaiI/YqxD family protein [Nitrospirota bacterium]
MKILLDADACPVRGIISEEAVRRGVPVIFVVSMAQGIASEPGVEVIRVDSGFQVVDMALVNRAEEGDIVVTSDAGLAALVLGKGGRALSFSGRIFHSATIDAILEKRHAAARTRRGGGRVKGPRGRNREDDIRFRENLIRLMEER